MLGQEGDVEIRLMHQQGKSIKATQGDSMPSTGSADVFNYIESFYN